MNWRFCAIIGCSLEETAMRRLAAALFAFVLLFGGYPAAASGPLLGLKSLWEAGLAAELGGIYLAPPAAWREYRRDNGDLADGGENSYRGCALSSSAAMIKGLTAPPPPAGTIRAAAESSDSEDRPMIGERPKSADDDAHLRFGIGGDDALASPVVSNDIYHQGGDCLGPKP
jgi:hypothetical protein